MRLETDLGTADVGMVEFEFNIFLCSLSPHRFFHHAQLLVCCG